MSRERGAERTPDSPLLGCLRPEHVSSLSPACLSPPHTEKGGSEGTMGRKERDVTERAQSEDHCKGSTGSSSLRAWTSLWVSLHQP